MVVETEVIVTVAVIFAAGSNVHNNNKKNEIRHEATDKCLTCLLVCLVQNAVLADPA